MKEVGSEWKIGIGEIGSGREGYEYRSDDFINFGAISRQGSVLREQTEAFEYSRSAQLAFILNHDLDQLD